MIGKRAFLLAILALFITPCAEVYAREYSDSDRCAYYALSATQEISPRAKRLASKIPKFSGEDDSLRAIEERVTVLRQHHDPSEFSHVMAAVVKRLPSPEHLESIRLLAMDFPLSAVHVRHIQEAILQRWGKNGKARRSKQWTRASKVAFQSAWGKDNEIYYHRLGEPSPAAALLLEGIREYLKKVDGARTYARALKGLKGEMDANTFVEIAVHLMAPKSMLVSELADIHQVGLDYSISPNHQALLSLTVRDKMKLSQVGVGNLTSMGRQDKYNGHGAGTGYALGVFHAALFPIWEPFRVLQRRNYIQKLADAGWGDSAVGRNDMVQIETQLKLKDVVPGFDTTPANPLFPLLEKKLTHTEPSAKAQRAETGELPELKTLLEEKDAEIEVLKQRLERIREWAKSQGIFQFLEDVGE